MAKKFVRGITDVKTIENQDFDTNNVNDLLSDGNDNYIHRKKSDGTQEYHNLTDNLKTLKATSNGLLTVKNENTKDNTATLTVNHDSKKSQVLASPAETMNIHNGENGSNEFTTVDVNPSKVLLKDRIVCDNGLIMTTNDSNITTLSFEPTRVIYPFDVNTPFKGKIIGENLPHSPATGWFMYENDHLVIGGNDYIIQKATRLKLVNVPYNEIYYRTLDSKTWSPWVKQVTDVAQLEVMVTEIVNNILNPQPQSAKTSVPKSDNVTVEKTDEKVAEKGDKVDSTDEIVADKTVETVEKEEKVEVKKGK